jgi:hypothetical protein
MSSPPHTSEHIEVILPGHVRLILVCQPQFYLEIPLNIICSLCLKPRKYLVFLGWCILGVEGGLAERHGSEQMELNGALDDRGLYYYVTPEDTGKRSMRHCCPVCTKLTIALLNEDLSQAVDLEVIKQRSNIPSETTGSRSNFRSDLLIRDACCVFTGSHEQFGSGMHIIPYRRGSEVCSTASLC